MLAGPGSFRWRHSVPAGWFLGEIVDHFDILRFHRRAVPRHRYFREDELAELVRVESGSGFLIVSNARVDFFARAPG